jgi:hypothetical protein
MVVALRITFLATELYTPSRMDLSVSGQSSTLLPIVLDQSHPPNKTTRAFLTKRDRDEQIRPTNCYRNGVAECYDHKYRLLWSVYAHEKRLSVEQQYHKQRSNQRQVDEGNCLLRHADRSGIYVLGVVGHVYLQLHAFLDRRSPVKASNMRSDGTQVTTIGETTIRWTPLDDGARVVYERWGFIESRATIVASEAGYRLIDENNRVLSEVEYVADGSLQLRDGNGQLVNR